VFRVKLFLDFGAHEPDLEVFLALLIGVGLLESEPLAFDVQTLGVEVAPAEA